MQSESALLARLRGRIAQAKAVASAHPPVPLGSEAADRALGGGLKRDGLHEFYAAEPQDSPAALAMALLCAVRCRATGHGAPLLWLRERKARRDGQPYGPGLAELGIDPASVILLDLPDLMAVLRAGADSLHHGGATAALLEMPGRATAFDLTASRRLALAAARMGMMVLVARGCAQPVPSVAHSRWRVASAPSAALAADAPGHPVFDLTLIRHRGGKEGIDLRLEWNRDEQSFRAPLSGGVSAPAIGGADRSGGRRAA